MYRLYLDPQRHRLRNKEGKDVQAELIDQQNGDLREFYDQGQLYLQQRLEEIAQQRRAIEANTFSIAVLHN